VVISLCAFGGYAQLGAQSGASIQRAITANTISLGTYSNSVDSFDSGNPAFSTNGKYDRSKARDNGDLAVNSGVINSMDTGNSMVYGHLATAFGGTIHVGSRGGVGSHAWLSTNLGIEPNGAEGQVWTRNDFIGSYTYVPVTAPFSVGQTPGGPVTNIQPVYSYLTNTVTSNSYPAFQPIGGVVTNANFVILSERPNPVPVGTVTNTVTNSVTDWSGVPVPTPVGTSTNLMTVTTNSMTFPASGTYVGTIETNYVTAGPPAGRGWHYIYNLIIGQKYVYPTYTYAIPQYYYTYNLITTSLSYATNSYDALLNSGDYYLGSLTGKVFVTGVVRLALTNGLDDNAIFTIPEGATLIIYFQGPGVAIKGNHFQNAGSPANLLIYGAVPSISFSEGPFTGIVFAPDANVYFNYAQPAEFTGAVIGYQVVMNGRVAFHYDESLSRSNPFPPCYVSGSQEEFVLPGQTATFDLAVGGNGPFSYQWKFGGTNISGATNSMRTIDNVCAQQAGWYSLEASNPFGTTSFICRLVMYDYSSRPPSLAGTTIINGIFRTTVIGVTGFKYTVEAATDFVNWTPVITNASPFFFEDPDYAKFPARYYRCKLTQ
jgi:hypothetical protein